MYWIQAGTEKLLHLLAKISLSAGAQNGASRKDAYLQRDSYNNSTLIVSWSRRAKRGH